MIKFLFAWWDTPIYLWSIKTLVGMFCMIIIPILPFAIVGGIIETIRDILRGEE